MSESPGLHCSLPLEVGQWIVHVAHFGCPLTFSNCPDRAGGCLCMLWGRYPLSAPSKRQKNTSVGLPKTVNQPNIPPCLLPPALHSLVTSHTWTHLYCFFLGNKKARQQWTEGGKWRHVSKCYECQPQRLPFFLR